jgi:hypothetical protein
VVNDYKPDTGKPPVMDAVLIPYRRSLLAIAAMKLDMAAKHKLQGAANPYLEWMQLPNGKARLVNAGARHALQPWTVNHADGNHLHMTHAIVGLLMALELHLTEEENKLAGYLAPKPITGPAGADWREEKGQWWTDDDRSWLCTCGAGRPSACKGCG